MGGIFDRPGIFGVDLVQPQVSTAHLPLPRKTVLELKQQLPQRGWTSCCWTSSPSQFFCRISLMGSGDSSPSSCCDWAVWGIYTLWGWVRVPHAGDC